MYVYLYMLLFGGFNLGKHTIPGSKKRDCCLNTLNSIAMCRKIPAGHSIAFLFAVDPIPVGDHRGFSMAMLLEGACIYLQNWVF